MPCRVIKIVEIFGCVFSNTKVLDEGLYLWVSVPCDDGLFVLEFGGLICLVFSRSFVWIVDKFNLLSLIVFFFESLRFLDDLVHVHRRPIHLEVATSLHRALNRGPGLILVAVTRADRVMEGLIRLRKLRYHPKWGGEDGASGGVRIAWRT